MQGKIVGGYLFNSKKTGSEWANIYVQVPLPENAIGGSGICVEKLMCSANRLPKPLVNMVNKNYFISTQNNFASDFFELPEGK